MFAELTTLRTPGGTAAIVIIPRLSRVSRPGDRDTAGRPRYPPFLREKCNAEGKRDSRASKLEPKFKAGNATRQGKRGSDRCRASKSWTIEIVS